MNEDAVLYKRDGSVGIITLNRPERLNAINRDLLSGLLAHLRAATEDDQVVTVILTGAGRSFCAGTDLKEAEAGKDLAQWTREIDELQEIQRVIMRLGKPLVAAIRGYAVGGGLEFAISCDIRIAADDAQFGFPETGVGLSVSTGATKLICQLVGLGKAKELLFTGEFIGAEEALRIGLINRIAPGESLMADALGLCRQIGDRSPLSLRLSRIALDQAFHSSMEQTLELETAHLLACVAAGNHEESVRKRLAEMKSKKKG